MRELGQYLKEQREKKQISLRKVADETKIPIRYLEAIEEENWDVIPGEVYLKGFLRSYAEEIGLDDDEVLAYYRQLTKAETEEPALSESRTPQRKKVSWHLRYERAFVFVLILVLLIVAVIAAFRGGKKETPPPLSEPQKQEAPKEAPKEEPKPLVEEPNFEQLSIFARDQCWVEAYSEGKRLFALMLDPGEQKEIPVRENLVLLLGKPSVVRLKFGEEEVAGLGKETVTIRFEKDGHYQILPGRREEEFRR